jgi:hypothetical protein
VMILVNRNCSTMFGVGLAITANFRAITHTHCLVAANNLYFAALKYPFPPVGRVGAADG